MRFGYLTASYTLASIFLQAVFVMYLSSSERIIGDILGRGDQFPIIFGVVAIMFGIIALLNGKLVVVFGIKKLLFLLFINTCFLLLHFACCNACGGWKSGILGIYSSVGDRSIDVHVYYAKSELSGTVPYG